MGKTLGGTLLTVADLIEDLSEESSFPVPTGSSYDPFSATPSSSSEAIVSRSESLDDVFERTYEELNLALTSSGHSWTNLTQQLYSALTSADQLVAVVNSNLKTLAEKVTSLKLILKRGDTVIGKLQTAAMQLPWDGV